MGQKIKNDKSKYLSRSKLVCPSDDDHIPNNRNDIPKIADRLSTGYLDDSGYWRSSPPPKKNILSNSF